jgi:ABC-type bacteriocin/lantibiotic exporter with double-glycine peptidase domain
LLTDLSIALLMCVFGYSDPAFPGEQSLACGPRALAIVKMLVSEEKCSRDDIVKSFENVTGDHSFDEIRIAAERLGLACRFAKYDPTNPALPNRPVIVPVRDKTNTGLHHFAIMYGRDSTVIQYIDYPRSPNMVALYEIAKFWDGEGLEFYDAKSGVSDPPRAFGRAVLWLAFSTVLISIGFVIVRKIWRK